jgi:predicted anti-sigma-YlaC factor YlaD
MKCREAREYLPAYLEEPRGVSHLVEGHLATCAHCRRELEEYRELAASLSSLREETVEPPGWLAAALIETVRERAERRHGLVRRAQTLADPKVAIAAGALAAAGVTGAILLSRKRRRRGTRRRLRHALAEA